MAVGCFLNDRGLCNPRQRIKRFTMRHPNDVWSSPCDDADDDEEDARLRREDRATPAAMALHYQSLKRECLLWRVVAAAFLIGLSVSIGLIALELLQDWEPSAIELPSLRWVSELFGGHHHIWTFDPDQMFPVLTPDRR